MLKKMRIAKFIANAGFCSRREAEKLIEDRIVKINNHLCLHPSETVNDSDKIIIGKSGKVEDTFASFTKPTSKKFIKLIEKLI